MAVLFGMMLLAMHVVALAVWLKGVVDETLE